jgi:hypothetical protein
VGTPREFADDDGTRLHAELEERLRFETLIAEQQAGQNRHPAELRRSSDGLMFNMQA